MSSSLQLICAKTLFQNCLLSLTTAVNNARAVLSPEDFAVFARDCHDWMLNLAENSSAAFLLEGDQLDLAVLEADPRFIGYLTVQQLRQLLDRDPLLLYRCLQNFLAENSSARNLTKPPVRELVKSLLDELDFERAVDVLEFGKCGRYMHINSRHVIHWRTFNKNSNFNVETVTGERVLNMWLSERRRSLRISNFAAGLKLPRHDILTRELC